MKDTDERRAALGIRSVVLFTTEDRASSAPTEIEAWIAPKFDAIDLDISREEAGNVSAMSARFTRREAELLRAALACAIAKLDEETQR